MCANEWCGTPLLPGRTLKSVRDACVFTALLGCWAPPLIGTHGLPFRIDTLALAPVSATKRYLTRCSTHRDRCAGVMASAETAVRPESLRQTLQLAGLRAAVPEA